MQEIKKLRCQEYVLNDGRKEFVLYEDERRGTLVGSFNSAKMCGEWVWVDTLGAEWKLEATTLKQALIEVETLIWYYTDEEEEA